MKKQQVKLEDAIKYLQDEIKRDKELLSDVTDVDQKIELQKQIVQFEKKLRLKFRELHNLIEKEREQKENEKEMMSHLGDEGQEQ